MSFGGILATALAGGAGVIGKQAGDDIADQRKAELLKQQADIEFQTQQRLAEMRQRLDRDQTLWKTQGGGGTATLDFNRRDIEQRNDLAIKGEVAKATNPELAAAKDTQAEAELQREIRKIQATAKPEAEKAAAIAEARAKMEAKYRKTDPTVATKIAELKKQLGRDLTEAETLQAYGLAKAVPAGDETVKTTKYDANGQPIEERTVKGPRGAEQPGAKPTEQQAHAEAEAAIKSGAPRDAVNARLAQAGFKPLGGAADKPGMSPGAERGARKPVAQTGPVAVAESQLRQATERLNSYGSSQRQRDPDGFRQAQAQVAEARAALAAAQESEAGPVTDSDRRPSTRYAAP